MANLLTFQPFGEKLQAPTDDFISALESEVYWPASRRAIHCSVSGSRYGTVDEAYVRQCIAAYGGKEMAKLEEMIARVTLFAGPSPLWQSQMPDRLIVNKGIDPYGYWIYMMRRIYKEVEDTMRELSLPLYLEWRQDIIRARSNIEKVDVNLIHRLNQLLTIMSGYGILPRAGAMPAKQLSAIAYEKPVRQILDTCGKFYKGFRKAFKGRMPEANRHRIHERVALRYAGLQDAPSKANEDYMHLLVSQLIIETDRELGKEAHQEAFEATGIRSKTFQLLKETKAPVIAAKVSKTGSAPIPAGTKISF